VEQNNRSKPKLTAWFGGGPFLHQVSRLRGSGFRYCSGDQIRHHRAGRDDSEDNL
jgi:hypothetical protein